MADVWKQVPTLSMLVKVPYLAVDRRGRDIARPGYRLPEGQR